MFAGWPCWSPGLWPSGSLVTPHAVAGCAVSRVDVPSSTWAPRFRTPASCSRTAGGTELCSSPKETPSFVPWEGPSRLWGPTCHLTALWPHAKLRHPHL